MVVVVFLPILLPECQPGDMPPTKWLGGPKRIVVGLYPHGACTYALCYGEHNGF